MRASHPSTHTQKNKKQKKRERKKEKKRRRAAAASQHPCPTTAAATAPLAHLSPCFKSAGAGVVAGTSSGPRLSRRTCWPMLARRGRSRVMVRPPRVSKPKPWVASLQLRSWHPAQDPVLCGTPAPATASLNAASCVRSALDRLDDRGHGRGGGSSGSLRTGEPGRWDRRRRRCSRRDAVRCGGGGGGHGAGARPGRWIAVWRDELAAGGAGAIPIDSSGSPSGQQSNTDYR